MAKSELKFEGFLSDIHPDFEDSAKLIHDRLVERGCQVKVQEAKSGRVVSFTDPGAQKAIANLVVRKSGPVARIYGDHAGGYMDVIGSLPDKLVKAIEKAPLCKRLIDPEKCNSRCPMGYVLTIGGTEHKKCRYSCFMIPVNSENTPSILSILDRELAARAAS